MFTSVSRPNHIVWGRLALGAAVCALFLPAAVAQSNDDKTLAPVLVSASRFENDPAFAPIGATVITAQEIRASGASNVNEAIRKVGGVYGRQSFTGSQDFSLDLRGFGGSGDQNLVVMVDGVRLSENELNPALLSSIPVESVERIEIVRGGSSVLYGEGATGGTIHIITRRPKANSLRGTVLAEVGSYDHRELRASVAKGWDQMSFDVNASTQRADNYRDNNEVKQNNLSAGLQWSSKQSRIGARIDLARQDARLPGALTLAQFNANPRQTTTPDDFGSFDTDRYTVFAEQRLGDFEIAAELSHREKTAKGTFVSGFGAFVSEADSSVTQFSPRVRHTRSSSGWHNELVAGVDLARWERDTDATFAGFPASDASASQKSRAVYIRDEIKAGAGRIAGGVRREWFDKDFADPLAFSSTAYTESTALNAWELQGSYTVLPKVDVFAKLGKSYRMPNVDENAVTPVPNLPLQAQTSRDTEVGMSAGDVSQKITLRWFRHRLKNEIFYDPTVFSNVNLDATRRQGVELEGHAQLASSLRLSAQLQHVSAKFTEGLNAGRDMVLVPRNTATVRLYWNPTANHSANLGVQWADSQRYGGDFDNTCAARIPSYTTVDARYAYTTGPWELAIAGSNLTDKDYFSNAFGACQSGIYPESGRQLKLSARLNF